MRKLLYIEVKNSIKKYITDNQLKKNAILPSEKTFQEMFNISKITLRRALDELKKEYFIYSIKGKGVFFNDPFSINHDFFKLSSFSEAMIQHNKKITSKIIEFSIITVPFEIKEKFQNQLNDDDKIYKISRIRLGDDIPLLFETTYMPVKIFPHLSYQKIQDSKYSYIENELQFKILKNTQEVQPTLCDEKIAEFLNINNKTPILKVLSTGFFNNDNQDIFEYSIVYFNPLNYQFSLTVFRN